MKKQKIFFTLLLNVLIVAAFGQSSVSSTKKGGSADSSIFVTKTYGNATYHPKLGVLPAANGGTGINNSTRTLTFGGNLNFAGAYTQTFTATGNTSVTLPTSGTLATLSGTETFANKTFNSQTSIYNPSTTGASYLNLTNGTTTNSPTTGFIMYLGGETPYPSSQLYSNTGGSLLMGANGQTGVTIEPAYGKVKIGPGTTPNARFKIGASTGLFPQLEIEPQALVAPAVNNTIENDGTDFWYTNNSGLRRKFAAAVTSTDSSIFATRYWSNQTFQPKFTVLAESKGGKGNATVYQPGSIIFQSATSSQLMEDNLNLKFDSVSKTLTTTKQMINGRAGLIPVTINTNNSQAIYIESQKGGMLINNKNTDVPGIVLRTDGIGAAIDSKEIAVKAASEKQAGVFTQTGEAAADVTSSVLAVVRDVNNANISGTWNCSGAMLDIVNNITAVTSTTGPMIRAKDANIERFVVRNDGRAYTNLQTDIKVSQGGIMDVDVTQVGTVGATPLDVFTKTIKANTLVNTGDNLVVDYSFIMNEATKLKSFTIYFGGLTLFSPGAFSMINTGGEAFIHVSIVKTGTNTIAYHVKFEGTDGSNPSAPLFFDQTSGTGTITLTSNQTLRVNAACGAGSADNGIVANFGTYMLNLKN